MSEADLLLSQQGLVSNKSLHLSKYVSFDAVIIKLKMSFIRKLINILSSFDSVRTIRKK